MYLTYYWHLVGIKRSDSSAKYVHTQAAQTYEIPEDGQKLMPKHVAVIIKDNTVQQAGIKYYIRM
jgi:hypothetical protein